MPYRSCLEYTAEVSLEDRGICFTGNTDLCHCNHISVAFKESETSIEFF